MKHKYSVSYLCKLLDINRSGYYKWLKRKGTLNRYQKDRIELTKLLKEAHQKHPSYGYHRLAHLVFKETGWIFSHNLAHKCCKYASIHSQARKHVKYKNPGEENIRFKNVVAGRWNAKCPLQIVTSDMTMFKNNGKWYEWTLLIDVFNNEILAHSVSSKQGCKLQYVNVHSYITLYTGRYKTIL